LFGTDGPWLHPEVELAKVKALRLSSEDERKVLSENFLRLVARVKRAPEAKLANPVRGAVADPPSGDDPWMSQPFFSGA
jgi:hypothetical protein